MAASSSTEPGRARGLFLAWIVGPVLALSLACSVDSAKSRYILAEKLYADGKYPASVTEFDKVVAKDPRGKLGAQALFRSAMIQTLYLGQHADAVRKFKTFIDLSPESPAAWEAQREIGEILYSRMEQYEQAIQHYRALLKARPGVQEAPEFLFRIGKSHFFLWQFEDAVATYHELSKKFPRSPWAEKAAYEIGVTYFTRGGQQPGGKGGGIESFQEAMDGYQRFLKRYPESALAPEARFGIASCLEELDQLDAAYHQYEALLGSYPSPNVIRIKLARIKERKAQRSR